MSTFLRKSLLGYTALVAALGVIASANIASADQDAPMTRAKSIWSQRVPLECRRYLEVSESARNTIIEWQQALSFAACIQDGSIPRVCGSEQLEEMVDAMMERLELPMAIYVEALAHGPESIQLRAVFQIGMTSVALSTRARSSIAPSPKLAASSAEVKRYHELHDRLEPILARARRAAWLSFTAIDQAAAEGSSLRPDPVERHMISTARRMLAGLTDAAPAPSPGAPQILRR